MHAEMYTNHIHIVCSKAPAIKGWHHNVAIDLIGDEDTVTIYVRDDMIDGVISALRYATDMLEEMQLGGG